MTIVQLAAWQPTPKSSQFLTASSAEFCCSYELFNGNSPRTALISHAFTKKTQPNKTKALNLNSAKDCHSQLHQRIFFAQLLQHLADA